jgi:hypothetical protein
METREELAKYFAEFGNVGAEIGVERGYFSKSLLEANPNLKLYCVDAWRVYKGYRDHTRQEKLDRYYEETKELLKPYNAEILRMWSEEALEVIPDESLDFVYIDANHDFLHATQDIANWSRKVRKGGIVAGHDYVKYRSSCECQVKDVVDAWCHAYKIPFETTKEDFPSWYFVKQ